MEYWSAKAEVYYKRRRNFEGRVAGKTVVNLLALFDLDLPTHKLLKLRLAGYAQEVHAV